MLVTDGVGDPHRIDEIVKAAILGGVRCVQVREPRWSARSLLRCCEQLTPQLDEVDGQPARAGEGPAR